MTNQLQQLYECHRNQLFQIISDLQQNLTEVHLKEKLSDIEKNLKEERFRLVVLGQFKRGKTTFINALLGEALLPTDVIPVTAVITEIRYGQQASASVYFHEGSPKETPITELAQFIAEEQNPANQKMVDRVIVTTPAKFLQNGLILVDTPGVGSVHEHNTRLTQEYLPQVDAAIFLFSADPPLTELEREFLQTILPLVPHVEFVLNKKDYLGKKDLLRVLQFNRDILAKLTEKEVEISAISALHGLQEKTGEQGIRSDSSGLEELEHRLNKFLMNSRGRTMIFSNAERICQVCNEWQNLRELEQKAQSLSIEELQQNLHKFTQYMETMKKNVDRLQFLLDGIKVRLLEFFDENTSQFVADKIPVLQKRIEEFLESSNSTGKYKLMQTIEIETNNQIIDHFEPYRLLIEKQVKEKYAREVIDINQEVKNVVRDIYRFSAELFQIEQMAETEEEIWRYKSRFFYKTWEATTSLDLIENSFITLLPRPLFYLLQKRHVRKNLPHKLERQRGRLRADILYGLQDNNRQFLYEYQLVVQRIQKEISTLIERQLQLKTSGEEKLASTETQNEIVIQNINSVFNKIERMKRDWEVRPDVIIKSGI